MVVVSVIIYHFFHNFTKFARARPQEPASDWEYSIPTRSPRKSGASTNLVPQPTKTVYSLYHKSEDLERLENQNKMNGSF